MQTSSFIRCGCQGQRMKRNWMSSCAQTGLHPGVAFPCIDCRCCMAFSSLGAMALPGAIIHLERSVNTCQCCRCCYRDCGYQLGGVRYSCLYDAGAQGP